MPVTEANLWPQVAGFPNTSCFLLVQTPSTTAPSHTRESWCSCYYRASHHHPSHPSLRSPCSGLRGCQCTDPRAKSRNVTSMPAAKNQTSMWLSAWMEIPWQGCCLCCHSPSSNPLLNTKPSWKCHLVVLHLHLGSLPPDLQGSRGNAALSLTHLTQTILLAEPATQSASKSPWNGYLLLIFQFWVTFGCCHKLGLPSIPFCLPAQGPVLISPTSDSILFLPSKQALSMNW